MSYKLHTTRELQLKHNHYITKSIANYFFLIISPANYHQLSVRSDDIPKPLISYPHQPQSLSHSNSLLHRLKLELDHQFGAFILILYHCSRCCLLESGSSCPTNLLRPSFSCLLYHNRLELY